MDDHTWSESGQNIQDEEVYIPTDAHRVPGIDEEHIILAQSIKEACFHPLHWFFDNLRHPG
jgi:hypothetical protein